MNTDAQTILERWCKGVNEGKLDEVLGLYDTSAVLLPTFFNLPLNTPEGIRGYFETLVSNDHLNVTVDHTTVKVQDMTEGIQVISGNYDWVIVTDGQRRDAMTRFTFVFKLHVEAPILHHHSSAIPQMN